jgi:uncharacterized protein YxeA
MNKILLLIAYTFVAIILVLAVFGDARADGGNPYYYNYGANADNSAYLRRQNMESQQQITRDINQQTRIMQQQFNQQQMDRFMYQMRPQPICKPYIGCGEGQ